jgi:dihydroflavonol-4-reductase
LRQADEVLGTGGPYSDEVFLTGGSGFVGGHILNALVERGYRVRALVREGREGLIATPNGRVMPVPGDLRRAGELVQAMRGCRYLIHAAAHYSFAPRQRPLAWEVNVLGTTALLEAARIAGVERAVVTSSSATVGPARGHRSTEEDRPPLPPREEGYHASKAWQEVAALAAQVPVVLLLPTAPVGPGDRRPTPTGKVVLDYMRGRIPATVSGGMNLVPVEDVGSAHVTALERGRPGERYLLGGEDLLFDDLWDRLAEVAGRPPPKVRLPHAVVEALARLDELRCRITGTEPAIPLEGARMSRHLMFVSSEKAARELGFEAGPVEAALYRAVRWFREQGYAT